MERTIFKGYNDIFSISRSTYTRRKVGKESIKKP